MPETIFYIVKILSLGAVSFIVAMLLTPFVTNLLYRYKLGKQIQKDAPVFQKLHQKKSGTPTMGGVLIWGTTLIVSLVFWGLASLFDSNDFFNNLNFLTRSETLLPLGVLVFSAIVGLADDLMGVLKLGPRGDGIEIKIKLLLYALIAIGGAWWFYAKLDWDLFYVPFVGAFNIGVWYIPVFIFVIVATSFSTNETDGLDGLAGGVLLVAFSALTGIALLQGRYNLAAFCSVIIGALLAFLWFNVHPARFFMGDTGSMSLGVTLGVIAMLTNSALLLPFIGFILVLESGSVILQTISKKIFKRKIFISTPIHHHFEAIGWPETKITMRFWIIAAVCAIIGLSLGIMSYQLVPIITQ
ncbi:MAG: phospho-N-acetylmuramoyl-pentapeptide-transferase [Parcubacteria group bacterium RIFCSPHIGHO2_01_FULL_47_10b]|nr:MAG: phospho-N-acetylmuramoyl-pentapeptide-transferase [Parcubacteria group bacterium RIFCSPHIGHO2_01_FULL_47_10b]